MRLRCLAVFVDAQAGEPIGYHSLHPKAQTETVLLGPSPSPPAVKPSAFVQCAGLAAPQHSMCSSSPLATTQPLWKRSELSGAPSKPRNDSKKVPLHPPHIMNRSKPFQNQTTAPWCSTKHRRKGRQQPKAWKDLPPPNGRTCRNE
jgi:hypothetical protein